MNITLRKPVFGIGVQFRWTVMVDHPSFPDNASLITTESFAQQPVVIMHLSSSFSLWHLCTLGISRQAKYHLPVNIVRKFIHIRNITFMGSIMPCIVYIHVLLGPYWSYDEQLWITLILLQYASCIPQMLYYISVWHLICSEFSILWDFFHILFNSLFFQFSRANQMRE